MNNDLKTVALLFGQISSSLIAIIFIWALGDSEIVLKIFKFFGYSAYIIKIILTFLILLGSAVSLYRILKMLPKDNKDQGDNK